MCLGEVGMLDGGLGSDVERRIGVGHWVVGSISLGQCVGFKAAAGPAVNHVLELGRVLVGLGQRCR